MGEATYYLKACFKSGMEAKKNLEPIRAFLKEGCRAETFWRENRDKKPETFWPEFEKQFPRVTEFAKYAGVFGEDSNNGLAGVLNFGDEDFVENALRKESGPIILYSAYVWHFADWEPMANFIVSKWGAKEVRWISDELLNPFDLL